MCGAVYCFVQTQTVAVGTEEVAAAADTAVEVVVVGMEAAAVAATRLATLAPGPASKNKQRTGLYMHVFYGFPTGSTSLTRTYNYKYYYENEIC
jgi:hypothetical protein